jgi:hypothetical protein
MSDLLKSASSYHFISVFTSIFIFDMVVSLKSLKTLLLKANIRLKLVVSNQTNLILLKKSIKIVSVLITSHNKRILYV